jgi:hypothetical protein
VREQLPVSEQAKLQAHEAAIARSTSHGDMHRAARCAEWAIRMADDQNQSHPRWKELTELHQVWKDTWFAIGWGSYFNPNRTPTGSLQDTKIQWTEDAVAVARALGEQDGWDASPWEALLVELIGIDAPHGGDDPD